jgi:transcriptional antiterminator NusG
MTDDETTPNPTDPADTTPEPVPPTIDPEPEAEAVATPEPVAEAAPSEADEVEAEAEVDEADEPEEPAAPAAPAPPVAETPTSKMKWYIVKVTSGREESIKAAIERRVKIEGLEQFFGQVYIPVERITEVKKVKETKNGEKVTKEKRVTKEKKKFPGYIMAEVEFNDQILYLFRETSGVGDFVGSGGPGKPPPPMSEIDVQRMRGDIVADEPGKGKGRKTVVKLDFEKGDKVRIREGAFANMEGEVKVITEAKEAGETPKVTVEVLIFGRPVSVELDYWHVDKV